MNKLLEDVNLSAIRFSQDGRDLSLDFIDMSEGAPLAKLVASGVILVKYETTFEAAEDGLAVYMFEVRCGTCNWEEALERLRSLGFSRDFKFLAGGGKWHFVSIESADLSLEICCKNTTLLQSSAQS